MKKVYVCLMLCVIGLLVACGKQEAKNDTVIKPGVNEIYIYYRNINQNELHSEIYRLQSKDDILSNVSDIMNTLENVEKGSDYASPFASGIIYNKCNHGQRKGNLELWFDINYDSLSAEDLLFFKACVVKSVLNLDGVNSVTMYLTDLANTDKETSTVSESFDDDSFNMAFDSENGYSQQGTITVYFANEDGTVLKEYRKEVEISNTTSLPRLVLETLIEGPGDSKEYTATIPKTTQIQKVSVKDGICYVDLSDEFYDAQNPLQNDLIVYSVVNSLVELPNVSKVQFLKNGEKQALFRGSFAFDGIFERNLDLIEQETNE